jgi:hypothetical protein
MLIDYKAQRTFDETLELDDPGNCAVLCHGAFRDNRITLPGDYYMLISTIMGKTIIIKWGPIMPDIVELPNGYSLDIKTFQYKEPTIERELKMFINGPERGIYEAVAITKEEALAAIPNGINYVATIS